MAAMAPHTPLPPHESYAQPLLLAIWIIFGASALVVGLRTLAATVVLRKMSLADHLMLGALLLTLIGNICTTISVHYGLGQHIIYLGGQQIVNTIKWMVIGTSITILCSAVGRVSFAVYMFQFVGTSRIKQWILHICIWSSLIVNVVECILVYVQCNNVEKVWNFQAPGKCWPLRIQAQAGYFQGAVNTLIDLTLTILPMLVVRTLRIPKATKFGLMFLLCLSVFAAIASVVKTFKLHALEASNDLTYTAAQLGPWFRIENAVVIIAASIPPCRALFNGRRRRETSFKASHYNSTGEGNSFSSRNMPTGTAATASAAPTTRLLDKNSPTGVEGPFLATEHMSGGGDELYERTTVSVSEAENSGFEVAKVEVK